jgi:RimJ/RimL family protein N-acetyltransferase
MEDQLALCPVEEDDLQVMENLIGDPDTAGEFAWFGWRAPGFFRQPWEENGLLGPDGGALMVVRGEERLGFVNWRRQPSTAGAYFWAIGIALLPTARGHGYGTQAQRLLVRYLFAHTPVHRIEADTEVDNIAEQKALEKVGFTREGVSRGAAWRDGEWRDGVRYGILRTDPAP